MVDSAELCRHTHPDRLLISEFFDFFDIIFLYLEVFPFCFVNLKNFNSFLDTSIVSGNLLKRRTKLQ